MSLLSQAARGAIAGMAGTVVIQLAEMAAKSAMPRSGPRMRGEPGEYMVQSAEQLLPEKVRQHVPNAVENVAAKSMGYFYGATFGAVYALVRPQAKSAKSIVADGAALGIACWAAGYLGWLPATKLMKPLWKQRPEQIANPIATHAVYGLATVGASQLLERAIG